MMVFNIREHSVENVDNISRESSSIDAQKRTTGLRLWSFYQLF